MILVSLPISVLYNTCNYLSTIVGIIDGKAPGNAYFNYKKTHFVLLAVCDAQYR